MFLSRRLKTLFQTILILILAFISWKALHYKTATPSDVFPYLTSLDPDVILHSQDEGVRIGEGVWKDILAVKSTLTIDQATPILNQIYHRTAFDRISWGEIDKNLVESIKRKKKILNNYKYYEPGNYTFPVIGDTWYDNTFGADREGGARKHEGTDLFGPEGTPIVSVCSGKIEKLGWNRLGGERVGVRGDDGNYYYYAHLLSIEPSLKLGQRITKGAIIGKMGHTGDALTTPDHLHFGIEINNGHWINPFSFLKVWNYQGFIARNN